MFYGWKRYHVKFTTRPKIKGSPLEIWSNTIPSTEKNYIAFENQYLECELWSDGGPDNGLLKAMQPEHAM